MGLYAIGAIKRGNEFMGLRLKGEITDTIYNYTIQEVLELVKYKNTIDNIEIVDGEIKWTSGSMERYPIIDANTLEIIGNERKLIVISKENTMDGLKYSVINGYGRTSKLDETTLINIAEEYGLANCKLITRNGKKTISAIKGSMKTIGLNIEWIKYGKGVIVSLPDKIITKLKMPALIDNETLEELRYIGVRGCIKHINFIDTIEVSGDIQIVDMKAFKNFSGLTRLIMNGKIKSIAGNVVNKNIEEIVLPDIRIRHVKSDMFNGCTKLRSIRISKDALGYIRTIGNAAFKNCVNTDVSKFITPMIADIGAESFSGTNIKEITLSENLIKLNVTAFNNCKDLNKVVIKNKLLELHGTSYRGGKDLKLFEGCGTVHLYVPYGLDIEKYTGKNVVIHINKPTTHELEKEKYVNDKHKKAVLKSKMLGLYYPEHDKIYRNTDHVLSIMNTMSRKDWEDTVEEIAVKTLRSNIEKFYVKMNKITVAIQNICRGTSEYVGLRKGSYLLISNRKTKTMRVVFLDLDACKEVLDRKVKYRSKRNVYELPYIEISLKNIKEIDTQNPKEFKVIRKDDTVEIYNTTMVKI